MTSQVVEGPGSAREVTGGSGANGLMSITIHISMTSIIQCEYCQYLTFKRCDKFKLKCNTHGGMYSAHYFWKN